MAVITISRQYGSGGDEVAAQVCSLLGYRFFNKGLMSQVAVEVGLSETEIVDFSEDNYKIRGFLERLFNRGSSARSAAEVDIWKTDSLEAEPKQVMELDEARSIALVQSTIQAAYRLGNVVIVGRGGQAVLKDKPDVLHVRIEAPLDTRDQRVSREEKVSLGAAQDIVVNHDRAAAAYLKHFYNLDWADAKLYDLVINTGKLDIETTAQLIVSAVNHLSSPVAPTSG